ncbi:MAG: hypothetical protein JSV58_07310 [Candidatus Bathyarchaeota archaeon]|nr:MAG: hypothetical protein JSV58_07310 [Candidatus Bathyarchaeota archaeon]
MQTSKNLKSESLRAIPYVFGILVMIVFGFIAYNEIFVINVLAMTAAVYIAGSIVVGRELKKLLNVFVISFLAVVVSDLCFLFLQQFVALCITLAVLLVSIKYSLIGDHDSGWFGALGSLFLGIIFLLIIEIILGPVRLFLI